MKSGISPKLRSFYQEVLKWIDMGCPEVGPFRKKKALCSTLVDVAPELFEEQRSLFLKEYDCCRFPFNQTNQGIANSLMITLKGRCTPTQNVWPLFASMLEVIVRTRDHESFDTLEDILKHLGDPDRTGKSGTWVAKNYSLSQLIKDLQKLKEAE